MKLKKIIFAICFASLLALQSHVWGLTLTGNKDISNGAVLTGTPDSITPSGLYTNYYWWADKDGTGAAGNNASSGLNLDKYNLTRKGDEGGFTLNLHDGTSAGNITWNGPGGGKLDTRNNSSARFGGPITITNAADITFDEIDTSGRDWYKKGGHITIHQSGNLTGRLIKSLSSNGNNGIVTLIGGGGLDGTPTGNLYLSAGIEARERYIETYPPLIAGYEKVEIGSLGILNYGSCKVSPASDKLKIVNIGDGGINIIGPLSRYLFDSGDYGYTAVLLQTTGGISLSDVSTYNAVEGSWVKTSNCDVNMEAGGDITVTGTIATYMRAAIGYGTNSGDIAISTTAGDVKLHNINSANKQTGKFRAGHLSVTAGGSIEIDGTINLRSERGNAYCGNLVLQAGNGKAITLNNLDFGNVNIVSFSGANGTFDITGEIANFDDTATSGTGAKNDPLVTTQTKLRIPAGQIVYYVYEAGVLNDALDGLAYRVADLGGTSGAGGILCAHRPAPGTLLLIK